MKKHKNVIVGLLLIFSSLTIASISLLYKNLFSATNTKITLPQALISKLQWGAYVGWEKNDITDFESLIGEKMDISAVFVHWGNEKSFPSYLAPIVRDQGKTLLIFWEAKDYNAKNLNDARFNYDSIIKGSWDKYINEFATQAKTYAGPIILVPFSEMNTNEAPWSGTLNNNTPAKHKLAYQRIRSKFYQIANVKFGWTVNNNSMPNIAGNQIEDYYPGEEYVDYVGVDGFNFGDPWQSFSEIFSQSINKLSVYNKPVYIFSFACAAGAKKAGWIKDGLGAKIKTYQNIAGWVWFNENKERDWRVNSDAESLKAFKSILP